jgi:hypothetical protein
VITVLVVEFDMCVEGEEGEEQEQEQEVCV